MQKMLTITAIIAMLLVSSSVASAGGISWRYEVKYLGTWDIQPNGDVKVVRQFTVPAMMYSNWKTNNIHMKEMRNFHPAISTVKVDDLGFEWDDIKRTLTLTMTVRGLAVNKGEYWEAIMSPGVEFSNIDQGTKKAYFHASIANQEITINGQDIVSFPDKATDIKNTDGRTLRYKMPGNVADAKCGESEESSPLLWWVLFGATLAGGVVMLGLSLVVSGKPAQ